MPTRLLRLLHLLPLALGLGLGACGGSSSAGGSGSTLIAGTWVSDAQPPGRGSFLLTGSMSVSGFDGTLSGTLQMYDAQGAKLLEEPVSGTLSEENLTSHPYWDISFASADGKVAFTAPSYDGHTADSQMVGSFTNGRGAVTAKGSWHSKPASGPAECVIDRAFYATSYTFKDLAWNGSKLVAVATPTGGSAGVYEIDTSGAAPVFALKALSPAPPQPTGIAWDGIRYWILSTGSGGSQLYAYGAAWSDALGTPVTVSGGYQTPTWIAAWDGSLWYQALLDSSVSRIDPSSGAMTSVATIGLDRPAGADFDGTSVWSANLPPGGVWAVISAYAKSSGALSRAIYAPENKSTTSAAGAVACEGNGFLWIASGQNLYRLDVR